MRSLEVEGCSRPVEIREAAAAVAAALIDGKAAEVSFAPGNATRYALLVSPQECVRYTSDGEYAESVSAGKNAVVVAWLNGPASCCVLEPGWVAPSYVMEKLRCGEGDANVVAAFVEWIGGFLEL